MAKLGDIATIQSGGTPARSVAEYWNDGTIPWVKISDIKSKHTEKTEEKITEAGLKNSAAKIFPKGTILYTIFATLGETTILDTDAATNQAIAGIRLIGTDIFPEFLYYYLLAQKGYVQKIGRGVAQNNINMKILRDFDVPVPPKEEQLRTIDELNRVSKLIKLRKQQLSALDELVKARFIEMFGEPRSNPSGFDKKPLKSTCKVITGNTPSRGESENYGDFIEWIKTDNIIAGLLNPTSAVEKLSEEGAKRGKIVHKGAILMACIAGSVASIGRVCVTDRTVAFNQQINAVIPEKYNVLFLYTLFQISKDYLIEEVNLSLKGILSKSKLENKEFIVPPLSLQNDFAAFVERVDQQKQTIQQSLEKLELMKKALMQECFG